MILAIDVHYQEGNATTAGVLFKKWFDIEETKVVISKYENVEEYVSGQFYRRELPCILQLLNEHNLSPKVIIIDGYVNLGPSKKGLGHYLFDALEGKTPIIIGVAKNSFHGISLSNEILRGNSSKPLYVTSIGIDIEEAKKLVISMHGQFRLPYLIKKADSECRNR